ncbi:MAG: peptidylprolyl isomerase [Chromatiales bacterium]|nr:peptidylprolyl isomerase [Chromatiales bacterium]
MHTASAEQTPAAQSELTPDTVIAVVNGRELTFADFNAFINTRISAQQRQQGLNVQQRNALITEYVNRELVYQDAVKHGWDKAPEVVIAVDNHRRNLSAQYALGQQVSAPIADADLEKAYRELKPIKEFKTMHILVHTEAEAKQILTALSSGKTFDAVAKESSIDPSAAQGGDLGWIAAEQIATPLRNAIVDMKKGSLSQPIQTQFGWHILRVDDIRTVPVPSFADVKDDLRHKIQNENIGKYLSGLRQSAQIEFK